MNANTTLMSVSQRDGAFEEGWKEKEKGLYPPIGPHPEALVHVARRNTKKQPSQEISDHRIPRLSIAAPAFRAFQQWSSQVQRAAWRRIEAVNEGRDSCQLVPRLVQVDLVFVFG